MALPPIPTVNNFKLAPIQVTSSLVLPTGTTTEGRPTSYFQRWLNDNNKAIQGAIASIQATLDYVSDALVIAFAEIATERSRINSILLDSPIPYAGGYTATAGFASIPHTLAFTPNPGSCTVFIRGFAGLGASPYLVSIVDTDATNLNIYVQDNLGVPVTGTVYVCGSCAGY